MRYSELDIIRLEPGRAIASWDSWNTKAECITFSHITPWKEVISSINYSGRRGKITSPVERTRK